MILLQFQTEFRSVKYVLNTTDLADGFTVAYFLNVRLFHEFFKHVKIFGRI